MSSQLNSPVEKSCLPIRSEARRQVQDYPKRSVLSSWPANKLHEADIVGKVPGTGSNLVDVNLVAMAAEKLFAEAGLRQFSTDNKPSYQLTCSISGETLQTDKEH